MRGPEHYREAEALARSAPNWMADWGPRDMPFTERLAHKNSDVAMAQVHATLALAAATALTGGTYNPVQADMTEWRMAAGNPTAAEEQHERDGGQS